SAYVGAGVGFNGIGGPQDFSFRHPENIRGRSRLGNENDTYMELTWQQAHLLGDSPDVMDVTMTFTPAIVYNTDKATFVDYTGAGFNFSMRQAYLELKNVIKSAPEVAFWGGQRFYDRHNIELHDYFFDDYSGYGAGVENINFGFSKFALAYLGGIRDDIADGQFFQTGINNPRIGGLYLHTIDARLSDIDLLGGKLELIGDFQFLKGGTFNIKPSSGSQNAIRFSDTTGFRVGAVYRQDFAGTGKEWWRASWWQLGVFYGWGASEPMGTDPNSGTLLAGYNYNRALGRINADGSVNSSSLQHASQLRANAQVTWNVSDNFAFQAEVHYGYDDQGSLNVTANTVNAAGVITSLRSGGGSRNIVGGGIRPVFWLSDWFAIQVSAGGEWADRYRGSIFGTTSSVGENIGTGASVANTPGGIGDPALDAFGRNGWTGVFSIAPTIKPKGGWFTKPELRVYATYAIWSDAYKGQRGFTSPVTGSTTYSGDNQGWLFGTQIEWYF
ncbi:MAG: carbohydrate porin, partial [Verrucomicrobia bacterium]|nr:carbohydrate porin [Verrucomicrobiota bacterium]